MWMPDTCEQSVDVAGILGPKFFTVIFAKPLNGSLEALLKTDLRFPTKCVARAGAVSIHAPDFGGTIR
jgi:hypothetical protein